MNYAGTQPMDTVNCPAPIPGTMACDFQSLNSAMDNVEQAVKSLGEKLSPIVISNNGVRAESPKEDRIGSPFHEAIKNLTGRLKEINYSLNELSQRVDL